MQRGFDAYEAEAVAVAAHPGISRTNLGHESAGGLLTRVMEFGRPFFERVAAQSSAMGALPTLRAATDPDVAGGDYFGPDGLGEQRGHPKKVGMSGRARSEEDAAQLWAMSEELTGLSFLD